MLRQAPLKVKMVRGNAIEVLVIIASFVA